MTTTPAASAADLPELSIIAIRDMAYIKKRNGWQATGHDATEAGTDAWMDGLLSRNDDRARVVRVADGSSVALNPPEVITEVDKIRTAERERIAAYLDMVAGRLCSTGLLGDEVSGNAFAQAASYCRDETIWAE